MEVNIYIMLHIQKIYGKESRYFSIDVDNDCWYRSPTLSVFLIALFFNENFTLQISLANYIETHPEGYFCCKCCKNLPRRTFFGNTGIQNKDQREPC